MKHSYRATALLHVGNSDHLAFILTLAYKARVQQDKPVVREVRIWPPGAKSALIEFFETTQQDIFREAATYNNITDLQGYSVSVTGNINKCIDDETVVKTIKKKANHKRWLTGKVHSLLRAWTKALKSSPEIYREQENNLWLSG